MLRKTMTPSEIIATFRDKPLDFPVGEKWSYSNSNYILLGAVIEKVSGVPYAQFLQDNLFTPLGMKDTGYGQCHGHPAHAGIRLCAAQGRAAE